MDGTATTSHQLIPTPQKCGPKIGRDGAYFIQIMQLTFIVNIVIILNRTLYRFKAWGEDNNDPHRRVEDIAFAVARFYQTGGTFQNYYMVSIAFLLIPLFKHNKWYFVKVQ